MCPSVTELVSSDGSVIHANTDMATHFNEYSSLVCLPVRILQEYLRFDPTSSPFKTIHNDKSLQIDRPVLPQYKSYWIKKLSPMGLKYQRTTFVNNTLKLVIYYLESSML